MKLTLPTDSAARKDVPVARGPLAYFPAAIAGVAVVCDAGNKKHNPGEPLHHARGKSTDHADCIVRHLMDVQDVVAYIERGGDHCAIAILLTEANQLAWRALALAQELHEAYGDAPLAPGARLPAPPPVTLTTPVRDSSLDAAADRIIADITRGASEPDFVRVQRCEAVSIDGVERCILPSDHKATHCGFGSEWDAAVPSGTVSAEPPAPDNRGCPEGFYRATWPLRNLDGFRHPSVWTGDSGTWWFNTDTTIDDCRASGSFREFQSEAEARAAYWVWKDAQSAGPSDFDMQAGYPGR